MARKSESERERRARAQLRDRHAEELRAVRAFFDVADRRAALEAELAELEHEEALAVANLVTVSDASAVAELVGWSVNRVRSAAKLVSENGADADHGEAVLTAAEVAS